MARLRNSEPSRAGASDPWIPSRLIGHRLRVRLFDDRLDIFIGGTHLTTLPRGCAHASGKHDQVVDYRNVIPALRRKPMALLNLVYRDQLFPRQAYRRTFDVLLERLPERQACRVMVELLAMAHERNCESDLAGQLAAAIGLDVAPVEPRIVRDRMFLLAHRHDRAIGDDGNVRRIHQEDISQTLGVPPEQIRQRRRAGLQGLL